MYKIQLKFFRDACKSDSSVISWCFKFFASNCVFINLCDKLNFVPGFSNINKCVYESFYSDCVNQL